MLELAATCSDDSYGSKMKKRKALHTRYSHELTCFSQKFDVFALQPPANGPCRYLCRPCYAP